MTKRLALFLVATLLSSLTALSQSTNSNSVIVVEARQSDMQPRPGILYLLAAGTNVYHATEPGPAESMTSQAWSLANEFVARTRLRDTVTLPAASAGPRKKGDSVYVVRFAKQTNRQDVILLVNPKEATVRLNATQ